MAQSRTDSYRTAVARTLAWLERMMPAQDGSEGVYERYRINVGQVNPWVRPDCSIEVGRLFYAAGAWQKQPHHRSRGERLARFVLSLQRKAPGWYEGSFPFYLFRPFEPGAADIGDRFGIPNLPDRAWPNDNGKITERLFWFYRQTGDRAHLDAGRRASDYLLRTQAADGTFSVSEDGEDSGFKGADFVIWPTLALAHGALATGSEAYRAGALRGLRWLRDHQHPSGRMLTSYETASVEAWRPPSSETVGALKVFAVGARLFDQDEDGWVKESLSGLAGAVLNWQHESGAIRNCDADCVVASLQNNPDVTDLVYTDGYALVALLEAYAATRSEELLRAAQRLADWLVSVQCWGEADAWDGGWRGSYHLISQTWFGSADQENELDEGGLNSVYTGWTAAPIGFGLLQLLQAS